MIALEPARPGAHGDARANIATSFRSRPPVYDHGIRRALGNFLDHWLKFGVARPRLVAAE